MSKWDYDSNFYTEDSKESLDSLEEEIKSEINKNSALFEWFSTIIEDGPFGGKTNFEKLKADAEAFKRQKEEEERLEKIRIEEEKKKNENVFIRAYNVNSNKDEIKRILQKRHSERNPKERLVIANVIKKSYKKIPKIEIETTEGHILNQFAELLQSHNHAFFSTDYIRQFFSR